jgi:hypothetical protein
MFSETTVTFLPIYCYEDISILPERRPHNVYSGEPGRASLRQSVVIWAVGDTAAAPEGTAGSSGAARVLSVHDGERTTWIILWVAPPRTESIHISPGSEGILPSQTRRARDDLARRRLGARAAGPYGAVRGWNPSFGALARHGGGRFETCPLYACGDGYDRRDNSG